MDSWNSLIRVAAMGLVVALGMVGTPSVSAELPETISPVRGHRYAAAQSWVFQFDAAGALVGRLSLEGEHIRGIAWGPGGLLYTVLEPGLFVATAQVKAVQGDGTVVHSHPFAGSISGNIGHGAIDFDYQRGLFYVGTSNGIYRFEVGGGEGERLTEIEAFSVSVMPNGDLLGLAAYALHRFSRDGDLLQTISNFTSGGESPNVNDRIIDGRGVLYDRYTGITYLTMLGSSAAYFQILMLDGVGPELLGNATFGYAHDLAIDVDGMLLVGSRTQAPAIYDRLLVPQGTVQGIESLFVAVFPPTAHIFDDSFEN